MTDDTCLCSDTGAEAEVVAFPLFGGWPDMVGEDWTGGSCLGSETAVPVAGTWTDTVIEDSDDTFICSPAEAKAVPFICVDVFDEASSDDASSRVAGTLTDIVVAALSDGSCLCSDTGAEAEAEAEAVPVDGG